MGTVKKRMYRPKRSNVIKMEIYYEKLKRQGLIDDEAVGGKERGGNVHEGDSVG